MALDLLGLNPKPKAPPKRRLTVPTDFLKYAPKYGWVQGKETSLWGRFHPNKHQLKLYHEIRRQQELELPVLIIILKARRLGITTLVQQYFLHQGQVRPGIGTLLVVQDQKTQGAVHDDMLRRTFRHLPEALQADTRESNRGRLVLPNESTFVVQVATGADLTKSNTRRERAPSQRGGRGPGYQQMHGSEVAFWVDAEATMLAVSQTVQPVPGTIMILESTANGRAGYFFDMWQATVAGENAYVPMFFTWCEDDGCRMTPPVDFQRSAEDDDLAGRYSLDDEQLYWRRWMTANKCNRDSEKFRQEYPLTADEAFLTTGNCWFDTNNLQAYLDRSPDPLFVGDLSLEHNKVRLSEHSYGPLRIYKHPVPGKQYAIGADVGEGTTTGAFSCAQVVDRDTLEQCAVWHGRLHPDLFGHMLCLLGLHYNMALLAPERNGPGIATLPKIIADGYPYNRLYKYKRLDRETGEDNLVPGWQTTPHGTRRILCSNGRAAIRDMQVALYDRTTLSEMQKFVDPGDGNPRGAPGAFDDSVMAYMIAITVAKERLLDYDERKEHVVVLGGSNVDRYRDRLKENTT